MKINLPLSRIRILNNLLDSGSVSLLDVGCGDSLPIEGINKHRRFYCVAVDVELGWLKESKRLQTHNDYVLSDARFLPFRKSAFDIIICLEVILYLSKGEALTFISQMHEVAIRQTIISAPIGYIPPGKNGGKWSKQGGLYGGKWSKYYKSSWLPVDMQKLGYDILGINGISLKRTHKRIIRSSFLNKTIYYLLSYLTEPLAYFFPNNAVCMLCVKRMDKGIEAR